MFGRRIIQTQVVAQHPAPALQCLVARNETTITVSAPFSTAVPKLPSDLALAAPTTTLIMLFYVQAMQADGAIRRNIFVLRKAAAVLGSTAGGSPPSLTRDVYGTVQVDAGPNGELAQALATLLPAANSPFGIDPPLSVLAVELLPTPGTPLQDPLGAQLGQQRILRVSPLTAIPRAC